MNKVFEEDLFRFSHQFALKEMLRGKVIVITGATGLIGSCVVRCLLALNSFYDLNIEVIAVARDRDKALRMFADVINHIKIYIYDFSSHGTFNPGPSDYLIHLACPTASRFFVEKPVETIFTVLHGTEAVLRYADLNNLANTVLVSTLETYGVIMDDTISLKEESQGYLNPFDVRSSYPMAKRMAEMASVSYAKEYGTYVTVARMAQTFGAGVSIDDGRVFAQFAHDIIAGRDIVLHTEGRLSRCYCYTTDAVEALLYIMLQGEKGGIYNVANPETYISIIEMARMLCREFNPALQVHIERRNGMGYSPETRLKLDVQRLFSLGWNPRYGLQKMFERLIDSLREDLSCQ